MRIDSHEAFREKSRRGDAAGVCLAQADPICIYHVSYANGKSVYKDFCDQDGIILAYTAISRRKDLQSGKKLRIQFFSKGFPKICNRINAYQNKM